MQMKHLSQGELAGFGEILSQCPPEEDLLRKSRMDFAADAPAVRYLAVQRIVLDYVSGMSQLMIFRDNRTDAFYLDRVVALLPGTEFAIAPMGEGCSVDILMAEGGLQETGFVPPALQEEKPRGLQFEKIYTFLYQECSHNFYFRGEQHRPYELVYVDRGALHNLVRGQDILLKQQQFMIIDSNLWHTQYSDLPVSFLTVSFWADDPGISAIINKAFSLNSQLKSIFKQMLQQSQQKDYSEDYMESLLKILLIRLLQKPVAEVSPQPAASEHANNKIVDRAVQLISANVQKKLTLEELAGLVHVSVPYLYKLFEVHLGTSPGKYIAKIRIEECKVLLQSGQMTMGQVAEHMHFSSLQHFSRQFRSICGITPSQYIRSLR